MSPSRRLVVFDPGLASAVGHHADVNALLLPPLLARGWAVEVWADAAAAAEPDLAQALPGLRPVLRDGGYIDPRHWLDLPGSLHQAALLRSQLEVAATSGTAAPVAVWLAHSLVPFQLIALAQLLQRMPPARVVISLMFAPGEVFGGQPEHDLLAQRQLAETCTRTALAALALAVKRGGHQLLLGAGSQVLIERYTPLCRAAGLPEPRLHPAVVLEASSLRRNLQGTAPQVMLHWGERKPDKGRDLALRLLAHRLAGGACPQVLQDLPWCFHASSRSAPDPEEATLLQRARADQRFRILDGQVMREQMLDELSATELALLAYCPEAYAERSSGVLWLYGAARLACGDAARILGRPGGWLAQEAATLGLQWCDLPATADPHQILAVMADAIQLHRAELPVNAYGRQVLGGSFPDWLLDYVDGSAFASR